MGWVGEVDCRYLTHPALRAPLQWRGSAVAELTLNIYTLGEGLQVTRSPAPSPVLGTGGGGCRALLFPKGGPLGIETDATLY